MYQIKGHDLLFNNKWKILINIDVQWLNIPKCNPQIFI